LAASFGQELEGGRNLQLPLDIAYTVIGVVLVVVGFIMVNSAVNRLASRIPSDPDPSQTERTPLFPPSAL